MKKAKGKVERLLVKGKLLAKIGNWKIYAPGRKIAKELEAERKKIKSGKAKYKKINL